MEIRKNRGVLLLLLGGFLIFFTACNLSVDNILNEVMDSVDPITTVKPATDEPAVDEPGTHRFLQYVVDCNTRNLVTPGELIQPNPGCDNWEINRYERPFNAVDQDEYYPDLDIQFADFGRDSTWFYLRIAVYDLRPASQYPEGVYGMELDLNQDGRGDVLVIVKGPGKEGEAKWSRKDVQIWKDSNATVGNMLPKQPDSPFTGDGYDELVFDSGIGDDPNAAWSRAFFGGSAYVELAFKRNVINNADVFTWWVWTDMGVANPAGFDYHDSISHEDAGDANEGMTYFPTNLIYAVDNTCASLWGALPSDDPSLCINDPNLDWPPEDLDYPHECPPLGFPEFVDFLTSACPTCVWPPGFFDDAYLEYLAIMDCDDPPPIEHLSFPPECPEMEFGEFVDWLYLNYPELDPTPDATLWDWWNEYLDRLDCPEEEPCSMRYDEWKAWWDSMNPGIDPSWDELNALWEAYLLDPFCEDPLPCESDCGDGVCECDEDADSSPGDCAACIPTCGDGVCECDEDFGICPDDCPECTPTCGDMVCECGETTDSCSTDCCGVNACGNGICDCGENTDTCRRDCCGAAACGNGVCDCNETTSSCPGDCPPPDPCAGVICPGLLEPDCDKNPCCQWDKIPPPHCEDK